MRLSTRNQQIALQAIELLNHPSPPENAESSLRIIEWFETLGITPARNEALLVEWEGRYRLNPDQLRQVAELEQLTAPGDWCRELLDHPLQFAAPGLFVAFVMDNGRYAITAVGEMRTSKYTTPLIGIEGMGKGWYDLDGLRRTKEGLPFQGSAYAGRIVPVSDELLALIERQELLSEITGYHRAPFREGGALHAASTRTLCMVRDLLRSQTHLTATDQLAAASVNPAEQ